MTFRRQVGFVVAPMFAVLIATGASFVACSETGPDAGPRVNGCIAEGCLNPSDTDASSNAEGTDGGAGGTTLNPGANPLDGITPVATLVKGGYQFAEGPVWIDDRLIFSDTAGNTLYQMAANGTVTPFRTPSNKANGNAVDSQGRLVTCESGSRSVTRTPALSTVVAIATTYGGSPFNEPNDVVVRASDGTIYFTDPCYQSPATGCKNKLAAYRLAADAPATGAQQLAFDFDKPNGIAVSRDGNTLYVVDNGRGVVYAASLAADGTVSGTFRNLASAPGGDGMAVDDAGNLYVAASAGVLVFSSAGKSLGTITLPANAVPSNAAFGAADRKTLFITANASGNPAATGLYRIALSVPGLP